MISLLFLGVGADTRQKVLQLRGAWSAWRRTSAHQQDVNAAYLEGFTAGKLVASKVLHDRAPRGGLYLHPLGHQMERWDVPDEQTLIENLTSFDTYEGNHER
jgi:hypothetical protein